MIRIAFPFIRKSSWAGGYNYLLNLFYVISLKNNKEFEPVLFYGTDVSKKELSDFFLIKNVKFIKSSLMNRSNFYFSLIESILFGSNKKINILFNKNNIDVVFENSNFFGKKIDLPVVAWIPDLQHRELPHLFSWISWWKREIGFRLQIASGRSIMLSSFDANEKLSLYYKNSINLINTVRFAVQLREIPSKSYIKKIIKKYSLPENYFFMPNQFWKHKNHDLVLQSLLSLKKKNFDLVVVSSGNQVDPKNPDYFKNFCKKIKISKLENNFIMLGLIPYKHVLSLMISSKAVLNPSLYEGRSTSVEESLALKIPLILSNIKIHKEQAKGLAKFFNPKKHDSLAKVLQEEWNKKNKKIFFYKNILNLNAKRIKVFYNDFSKMINNTITFYNNRNK
jgi:glycosyltransferase involved in cell wall biosynthesis